jgi:hypothetical protein
VSQDVSFPSFLFIFLQIHDLDAAVDSDDYRAALEMIGTRVTELCRPDAVLSVCPTAQDYYLEQRWSNTSIG